MTTKIQRDMINLQEMVYANKYFTALYERCLGKHGMSVASVNQSEVSDHRIVSFANTFWYALPDMPTIRTPTFFALCNIAEQDCCDDEPDYE